MVALSFKVFKEKLLAGTKDQTIRKQNLIREEQMARLGIQAYWKQRTKECEKLFNAKLKEKIFQIRILPQTWEIFYGKERYPPIRELLIEEKDLLSRRDGFDNREDFFKFFVKQYGLKVVEDSIWSVIRFGKVA